MVAALLVGAALAASPELETAAYWVRSSEALGVASVGSLAVAGAGLGWQELHQQRARRLRDRAREAAPHSPEKRRLEQRSAEQGRRAEVGEVAFKGGVLGAVLLPAAMGGSALAGASAARRAGLEVPYQGPWALTATGMAGLGGAGLLALSDRGGEATLAAALALPLTAWGAARLTRELDQKVDQASEFTIAPVLVSGRF